MPVRLYAEDWESLGDSRFITGSMISAYLSTVELAPTTHVFQPYFYQKILQNYLPGMRKYIPDKYFTRWYIPVIQDKHWVAIIVDKKARTITQLDTVSRDIDLAEEVLGAMNNMGELIGYKVGSA